MHFSIDLKLDAFTLIPNRKPLINTGTKETYATQGFSYTIWGLYVVIELQDVFPIGWLNTLVDKHSQTTIDSKRWKKLKAKWRSMGREKNDT